MESCIKTFTLSLGFERKKNFLKRNLVCIYCFQIIKSDNETYKSIDV